MKREFIAKSFDKEFSNNKITIGFSGTIYNKTVDKDDCQYIYNLYQKDGIDLIKRLDAIYTLYIHDKLLDELYIARDHVGIYPLYIYDNIKTIIFGRSLKDFHQERLFKSEIDIDALSSYLSSGYIIQPYSIFKNTKKIKAGSYMQYDLKDNKKKVVDYWSYENELDNNREHNSEADVIKNSHHLLQKSIQKRLKTDPNYATTLSGGYDSSLIAALLSKTREKKLSSYTIGFNDNSINEAVDAKKIAQYLGCDHHEHYFSDKDALEIVPKLCDIFDEPFADYGGTPTILLTSMISQDNYSSIFVGDGGDEVFATADDLVNFQKYQKIPKFAKSGIYHLLNLLKNKNYPTKYQKFLNILNSQNIPKLIQAKTTLFNRSEIDQLLLNRSNPITTFDKLNFNKNVHLVDQITATYFKTSMADTELIKSFQTTQNANLNLQSPFLDIDLIRYLSHVPQSIKVKKGEKKHILKEITHKYIDKKLLDRPKSGFNIPFSSWMRGVLKELVYENINEKRLNKDKIFDTKTVIKLRDQFYNGNENKKYKLWTIFIFQMWFKNIKA